MKGSKKSRISVKMLKNIFGQVSQREFVRLVNDLQHTRIDVPTMMPYIMAYLISISEPAKHVSRHV